MTIGFLGATSLLLSLSITCFTAACAADPAISQANIHDASYWAHQASSAWNRGDRKEVKRCLQKAEEAESAKSTDTKLLCQLADLNNNVGQVQSAERFYHLALKLLETAPGKRSTSLIKALTNLASLELAKNDLTTSESLGRRALSLALAQLDENHFDIVQAQVALSNALNGEAGKIDESEHLLLQADGIDNAISDFFSNVQIHLAYSDWLAKKGKMLESNKMRQAALALSIPVPSPATPGAMETYAKIAEAEKCLNSGELGQSVEKYKSALASADKWNPEQIQYEIAVDLADALARNAKKSEAILLINKRLAKLPKVHEVENSRTTSIASNSVSTVDEPSVDYRVGYYAHLAKLQANSLDQSKHYREIAQRLRAEEIIRFEKYGKSDLASILK